MVVITLNRRKSQSDFKSNQIINKATSQLTKTAMLVTIIFIISLGFDLWYYVLAYNGVVAYILNSPLQVKYIYTFSLLIGSQSGLPSQTMRGLHLHFVLYRKNSIIILQHQYKCMTFCFVENRSLDGIC